MRTFRFLDLRPGDLFQGLCCSSQHYNGTLNRHFCAIGYDTRNPSRNCGTDIRDGLCVSENDETSNWRAHLFGADRSASRAFIQASARSYARPRALRPRRSLARFTETAATQARICACIGARLTETTRAGPGETEPSLSSIATGPLELTTHV